MKKITFFDGAVLIIESSALEIMKKYCQSHRMVEAGGILLGKYSLEENIYIICDVTTPSPKDKCTRNSFIRNKENAQLAINYAWENTQGILNYIGEWHTHAEINPNPSIVDRALIRQVIKDRSNVFDKVFLVILGSTNSLYIGVADTHISSDILFSDILEGE